MTTGKTILQKVNFACVPKDVYEALMDEEKHAAFTGGKATIERRVGGKFSTFDGWAEGKTIELIPNQKIVQEWRGSDWPEGVYSRATFALKKSPSGGTLLTFTQTGVPAEFAKDIAKGWKDYYWKPMKELLERKA